MHPYRCETCLKWFEGAAYRPLAHTYINGIDGVLRHQNADPDHGRDIFGRDRCDCPRFCSTECRVEYERSR